MLRMGKYFNTKTPTKTALMKASLPLYSKSTDRLEVFPPTLLMRSASLTVCLKFYFFGLLNLEIHPWSEMPNQDRMENRSLDDTATS
jgi:hypothetical protein